MNLQNLNPGQIIGLIASWIATAIGYGLLLLIGAAVAAKFGVRVPYVPATNETALAWLCGAWWLYRGGRLG
jgi:uncharacterized membrane protein (Fun14 family)